MLVAEIAASELRPESMASLERQHVLEVTALTPDELELFVTFAVEIDDGEAATIAICLRRELQLATDDRKAISFARSRGVRLPIMRTSDLVREWARVVGPSPRALRAILEAIRDRASFVPPLSDPNRDWWLRTMQL